MPEPLARHFIVRGRVQGVAFRATTRETAAQLDCSGWVRNCADGSVEVIAQGSAAALAQLGSWLQHGPPLAQVESVDCKPTYGDPALKGFTVRY